MCCDVAGFQSVGSEEEMAMGMARGSLPHTSVWCFWRDGGRTVTFPAGNFFFFPLAQPSDELNQLRASLYDLGHWLEVVVLL